MAIKVKNGENAIENRFPSMVSIQYQNQSSNNIQHICGGVLIEHDWILTAAGCIYNHNKSHLLPVIGSISTDDSQFSEIESIITHESFDGNPLNGNDIALIKLKDKSQFAPIHLPDMNQMLYYGMYVVALGWGHTNTNTNTNTENYEMSEILQVASSVIYIQNESCQQLINDTIITDAMLCVSGVTCKGDEGGPLITVGPSSYDILGGSNSIVGGNYDEDFLFGISSFHPGDCDDSGSEIPSVFTSVTYYLTWINDTISNYVLDIEINDDAGEDEVENVENLPAETKRTKEIYIILVCTILLIFIGLGLTFYFIKKKPKSKKKEVELSFSSDKVKLSPFFNMDAESIKNDTDFKIHPHGLRSDLQVNLTGKIIGNGGFGSVQEGEFTDDNGQIHKVAVKLVEIDPDSRQTILNELQVFEKVGKHPNVVHCYGGRVHDSIEDARGVYIIEELMMTDLGKYVKNPSNRCHLTYKKLLCIFRGVVCGLEHLHSKQIVHFDLKPGNILLNENLMPKLADFGCSRERAQSYVTAAVRGTIAYMAPELWLLALYVKNAQVKADKIDIFSFGVVMWECITGKTVSDPFKIDNNNIWQNKNEEENQNIQDDIIINHNTNTRFLTERFPINTNLVPYEPIRQLIWDCVSYYNHFRPSCEVLNQRITQMMEEEWTCDIVPNHDCE